jgi:hypothetical protein
MADYSTRNIIDYAMDDDGVKFRDALYANIHDKVSAHVTAAKQAVAMNMYAPEAGVEESNTEDTAAEE